MLPLPPSRKAGAAEDFRAFAWRHDVHHVTAIMASGLSPAVRPGPIKQKTCSVEEPHESSHNAPRRQCRHRRRSPVTRTRNKVRFRPRRRADQDRLRHGADRPARAQRPAGAARQPDLGRGSQRQRRPARPSGAAHPLRRSIQSIDRAGHLHQTARRRQSRPRDQRLCDQHGRSGHSHRHAKEQALHQPVRARCQRRVQIPAILFVDTDGRTRTRRQTFSERLLPGRRRAKSEAANLAIAAEDAEFSRNAMRWRARKRETVRLQGHLRQNLPAELRPTFRRSSAPSRPPIRTLW